MRNQAAAVQRSAFVATRCSAKLSTGVQGAVRLADLGIPDPVLPAQAAREPEQPQRHAERHAQHEGAAHGQHRDVVRRKEFDPGVVQQHLRPRFRVVHALERAEAHLGHGLVPVREDEAQQAAQLRREPPAVDGARGDAPVRPRAQDADPQAQQDRGGRVRADVGREPRVPPHAGARALGRRHLEVEREELQRLHDLAEDGRPLDRDQLRDAELLEVVREQLQRRKLLPALEVGAHEGHGRDEQENAHRDQSPRHGRALDAVAVPRVVRDLKRGREPALATSLACVPLCADAAGAMARDQARLAVGEGRGLRDLVVGGREALLRRLVVPFAHAARGARPPLLRRRPVPRASFSFRNVGAEEAGRAV